METGQRTLKKVQVHFGKTPKTSSLVPDPSSKQHVNAVETQPRQDTKHNESLEVEYMPPKIQDPEWMPTGWRNHMTEEEQEMTAILLQPGRFPLRTRKPMQSCTADTDVLEYENVPDTMASHGDLFATDTADMGLDFPEISFHLEP